MTKRLLPAVLLATWGFAGCSHTGTVAETAPPPESAATRTLKDDVFSDRFWRDPAIQEENPKFVSAKPIKRSKRVYPSQVADGTITYCGELLYGENNRHATDLEVVPYSMRVDCNSSGAVDEADGIHMAEFDRVKPVQKGHITRWRQKAAQTKGSSGVPYLCFRGETANDPCSTMETTKVRGVSFTSLHETVLDQLNKAKKK